MRAFLARVGALAFVACFALGGGRLGSADCDPYGTEPPQPDCNANGVADPCDISAGTSADCNRNGIPDECDPDPSFVMGIRGPDRVEGDPGSTASVPFSADIRCCGSAAREPGASGWILHVKATSARLVEPTTAGTLAESAHLGGFEWTGINSDYQCGYEEAIASAVVLHFKKPVYLPPAEGPHEVLRFRIEAELPQSGVLPCVLWIPGSCVNSWPETDGSGADGGPIPSCVTWKGESVEPLVREPNRIEFASVRRHFRRGDTNDDGRVDVSDAVRTFMWLFQGASEPPCLDATDANDDGLVDLSDGIKVLQDFFIPGTAIPSPGPRDCGPDPTPDGMVCHASRQCP